MSDRLPPGTTPQDIDDNFGDPGGEEVTGIVVMEVRARVMGYPTEKEKREAIITQANKGNYESLEVPEIESRRCIP